MISYINGTVKRVEEDGLIIIVKGIGYSVFVPDRVREKIRTGQDIELYTHQYVREATLDLYGFPEYDDLVFFKQLIQVSGVGARLGLALLSEFASQDLKKAIIHGDVALLSSVSGVGKKTAERIVLDLKDSIAVLSDSKSSSAGGPPKEIGAIDILLGLGYSQSEAIDVLHGIDSDAPVEEQVKDALKKLSIT
ncbi:MAG: Holliday junction branch migration protein RuvA [Candidatus Kerfeldbacteria bacterium]